MLHLLPADPVQVSRLEEAKAKLKAQIAQLKDKYQQACSPGLPSLLQQCNTGRVGPSALWAPGGSIWVRSG